MTRPVVQAPDLPELESLNLADCPDTEELDLCGVLLTADQATAISPRRVRVEESELRSIVFESPNAPGLTFTDAVLRNCDLSNVEAPGGSVRRCVIADSRLVGFSLVDGQIQDLQIAGTAMSLASLARTQLTRVVFEAVDLRESVFMQARLGSVAFVDCELAGSDFRGVQLTDCTISGCSLDDVIGVESMRGLAMPWTDMVASAGAFASALGITATEADRRWAGTPAGPS